MAGGLGGEAQAVAEALAATEAEAGRALQAVLFDDLDVAETGALDRPSPLSPSHPLADLVEPKRKGRPPGSKNRRTEKTVAWLLSTGRHPVAVMIEAYTCSPAELADKIGLSKVDDETLLELFKLQLRMAEAAAPYVAQRLPQAVQIDAKGSLTIGFEGVSFPARGPAAGISGAGGGMIEAEMAVRLPGMSDADGRTPSQSSENIELPR